MKLRRLNEKGLQDFADFIDRLALDPMLSPPSGILEDSEKTDVCRPGVEVERRKFSSRFEAAAHLYNKFIEAGISDNDLDRGVWAWLALLWFDQLCPPPGKKARGWPGEQARWIPTLSDYRKHYRHLLAGPWRAYRFHSGNIERARVLLCGPLYAPGDVSEQILSRQELVTNRGVVEVATRLYYDPLQKKLKRGAAGKGPGSARRYADVLNQFDVTWDLYEMGSNEITTLLPQEFDRFMAASRT